MASLEYFIIHSPIKEIAKDLSLTNDAHETDTDDLKENPTYDAGDSVMTVCDNFVTIYGHPTWKKKFGR
jgi:hypothetical protein